MVHLEDLGSKELFIFASSICATFMAMSGAVLSSAATAGIANLAPASDMSTEKGHLAKIGAGDRNSSRPILACSPMLAAPRVVSMRACTSLKLSFSWSKRTRIWSSMEPHKSSILPTVSSR